ncbi:MAG: glutamate 5-kinase, partial [Thermodesulfobacteriota bacterium]|nr:glutamate 5-kinase [Thermodesulfobacteriota bacterium]
MSVKKIRADILKSVKRVVIKLGSSVVTTDQGLDHRIIRSIAEDVSQQKKLGKEFMVVSSGAIAAGVRRMKLKEGPRSIPQKQAAASVGQSRLMAAYEAAFGVHNIRVGQMLLTKDDFSDRRRYLNARNTLTTLLSWGAIPIINENDTVVVDEIKLGDNDNLSALVAAMADADLLLTLSDIEGLLDCDPRANSDACLIPEVEEITSEIRACAGQRPGKFGRGGMVSKLDAAEKVRVSGIPMIIVKGKIPGIVGQALEGRECGTIFLPAKEKISSRKHWIRYNLEPEGDVQIDAGAAKAISTSARSLLPSGVIAVHGVFEHGSAVSVLDEKGNKVALGLINYSSDEIEKIMGHQTVEID